MIIIHLILITDFKFSRKCEQDRPHMKASYLDSSSVVDAAWLCCDEEGVKRCPHKRSPTLPTSPSQFNTGKGVTLRNPPQCRGCAAPSTGAVAFGDVISRTEDQ